MASKRVLIIGGTGQISTALTMRLASEGYDVTLFNRGQRQVPLPPSVRVLQGDRNEREMFKRTFSADTYDIVFDFICWGPTDAASDVVAFQERCGHFFYISTAWVYGPPQIFPTPEMHPCEPIEGYGWNKLAAETTFWAARHERRFPVTVIRFHATYDDQSGPSGILGGDETPLFRMRHGKPILLHDRGTHLTQFLHAEDAALALQGLMERPEQCIGEAFNVAGEVVTWRDYFTRLGSVVGLQPRFASVPTELLIQWAKPHDWPLMGVHQFNMLLDTSKLMSVNPDLRWQVSLEEGFRRRLAGRSASLIDQDPDPTMTARIDAILQRWQQVLRVAGITDQEMDAGWQRWIEGR